MKILKSILIILIPCVLFFSCTSAVNIRSNKDSSYKGGEFKKIFVMAITKDTGLRRAYEDDMVRSIKQEKADAIQSLAFLSQSDIPGEDTLKNIIRENNFDGFLVMLYIYKDKYVSIQKSKMSFYGFVTDKMKKMKEMDADYIYGYYFYANLFSTTLNSEVWNAYTKTKYFENIKDLTGSVTFELVNEMVSEKLLECSCD